MVRSAGSVSDLPRYGCSHASQMPFIGSVPLRYQTLRNATTCVAVRIGTPSSYFAAWTTERFVNAVGSEARAATKTDVSQTPRPQLRGGRRTGKQPTVHGQASSIGGNHM